MKCRATLSIAACLALGFAAAAHAQPTDNSEAGLPLYPVVGNDRPDHPYHPCHGRAQGTADASCGTLTGGPSGGLF